MLETVGRSAIAGADGAWPAQLFRWLPAKAGGRRQADEQHAADVALDLEIAAAALQPVAGRAGGERVAAVGDEAERA